MDVNNKKLLQINKQESIEWKYDTFIRRIALEN